MFGKIRFDLVGAYGEKLGQIKAENWRAWDFSIVDRDQTEVGRIDKKFVGVMKAVFTTADNYVVNLDARPEGDFRLLVMGGRPGRRHRSQTGRSWPRHHRRRGLRLIVETGCSLTAVGTVAQR